MRHSGTCRAVAQAQWLMFCFFDNVNIPYLINDGWLLISLWIILLKMLGMIMIRSGNPYQHIQPTSRASRDG